MFAIECATFLEAMSLCCSLQILFLESLLFLLLLR